MNITLNSKEEFIDTPRASLTINELRSIKKYSYKSLIVKINGELVRRENFDSAEFQDGDNVEIIHLIAGG